MLDINYIRDHLDEVKENTKNRKVQVDFDKLISLDNERRDFIQQIEELRAERNKKSKGKPGDEEIRHLKEVGEKIKQFEDRLVEIESVHNELHEQIPNLTHPDSPVGGEEDFATLETHGDAPSFDFDPKDHEALMTESGLIDFERGAKVAGSKFYFVQNNAVRLNQALIQFGMDKALEAGFTLVETPDLAKQEMIEASGFNPRGEESQIYQIENHDLSLIGTAEITMLGYHAGETLDLSDGPKKYAALSHCYRTEAGSYGKASKGLYRVHQFTKLELFVFCHPDQSEQLHQEILELEKSIMNELELPYRVIDIPTGDLGGPAYRKYDIEAWMPFLEDYSEITSCSNCTDYQARRLGIRYKQGSESGLVHTLNGTAIVLSRFPLAIVENNQQADGRIVVPPVLRPYMGGLETL